jgi:hypothetical protein
MRVSATNYLLLGVISFAAFFGIQALIVPYLLPAPTIEVLNHPLEVAGTYTYRDAGRSGRITWINGKKFYCGAAAFSSYSCVMYINGLPRQAPIALRIVNIKTIYGTVPVAMSVKSSGKEFFSQTPLQFMNAWKRANNTSFWFYSFSFAFCAVAVTHVYLTRNKMA